MAFRPKQDFHDSEGEQSTTPAKPGRKKNPKYGRVSPCLSLVFPWFPAAIVTVLTLLPPPLLGVFFVARRLLDATRTV